MANGWGGKRQGSGRKAGTPNSLPLGWVKAARSLRSVRLPSDATQEQHAAFALATNRTIDVMLEKVKPSQSHAVLKAASQLADLAVGSEARQINVTGKVTLEALVLASLAPAGANGGISAAQAAAPRLPPTVEISHALPASAEAGDTHAAGSAEPAIREREAEPPPFRLRRKSAALGGSGGGGPPNRLAPPPPGTPSGNASQVERPTADATGT